MHNERRICGIVIMRKAPYWCHRARLWHKHADFKEIKTSYFDGFASVCSNLHQTSSEPDELSPKHWANNPAGPTTNEIHKKVVRIYRLTTPLVEDFVCFQTFCVR